VSSQLTKAVRDLGERFEHRLFLTATPHNGHSNSFSALLEMLDPQRFERGIEVRPRDLEPVMVRRLKSDLREVEGAAFPRRVIEPIIIEGLPSDAPELELARRLADYGQLRQLRIAALPSQKGAMAKLAFVGLQQRLLSSIAAFARTLKVHRRSLAALAAGHAAPIAHLSVAAFVAGALSEDEAERGLEGETAEHAMEIDEEAMAEAATLAGGAGATPGDIHAELAAVDEMLAFAESHANRQDARVRWLLEWIRTNMLDGAAWNTRRLIVFTEYEDTRRWLERRLREALDETDRADDRIGVFTGATPSDRREEVKRAFNADPDKEPIRILICTDAAREGINLQTRCSDLIHLDLPWNPSRLEQRNGRIDRKLQPAPVVTCRYFSYAQRETDIVLDALVKKTARIRDQLGSAGQVIEARITRRMAQSGIAAGEAKILAAAIAAEDDPAARERAALEMDDETAKRRARLLREQDDLRKALERSRLRVGVKSSDLKRVAATALGRAGFSLDAAEAETVGRIATYRLDPSDPAFTREAGWNDAFDDLRIRPRKRGERPADWRRDAPVRAISFDPPVLADGRDADGVVQVHLEHRLVRRLISRFLSQGFQSRLSRVSVIQGPGAQPRVVLMGRLALFGAKAARLHEEIIPITAIWSEADRERRPLRALGETGEERTLDQLEDALENAQEAPVTAVTRIARLVDRDIADLLPSLESIAERRRAEVAVELEKRGEEEARLLTDLLRAQQTRITKASADFNPVQLSLDVFPAEERREVEANRRHWAARLARLESELQREPQRLRQSFEVRAHRLEPVGLVYLWPVSG